MTAPPEGAGWPNGHAALWLGLIILLGLGLRLAGLVWGQDYSHFGQGDAIEAYSVAVDYGLGSPRALYLGQPNFNAHSKLPGPLWTMFCFICCRWWGSVEGIVLAIILLNTAAIYLTYLLARRTVGPGPALLAALFTAIFPWVVYYSVGVYNPDVMSFLSALLFLALWDATQIHRAKAVFWVPLLLLAMPQVHMAGFLLFPAVVLVLVLCPVRLHVPSLMGGVVAGLALYWPYVRGEMANGWQNTSGILGGGASAPWETLKAFSAPLSFLVSWAPEWARNTGDYRELGRACFGSFGLLLAVNVLSAVVAGFLVVGAFLDTRKAMRGFWTSPRSAYARSPGILFLTILFLLPLIAVVVSRRPFHTRYCTVLLPVMLPLAAAAAARWLGAPRLGRAFRVALILTCCADVWLMLAMYHSQGRQIEQGPNFIPSFRKLETIYRCLKTHAGANSPVQIDIAAFLHEQAVPESVRHDAILLASYVWVREKENGPKSSAPQRVAYRLCPANQGKPDDPALAYRGNGVALVAVPPVR